MAKKTTRRGRGEGTIFQRTDGRWEARVDLGVGSDGKRNRKSVYGGTKQEVLTKLRELQHKHNAGTLSHTPQSMTVQQFLEHWMEATVRTTCSPKTVDRYQLCVNKQIGPQVGHVKLSALQPFHISNMYVNLEKQDVGVRTRSMAGTVLSTALTNAIKLGLIKDNPVKAVTPPKVPKVEMQCWDADQVRKFLAAAQGERLEALFVLAVDTGMRLGELLGLQWPDVDWDTYTIQVRRSLEEVRGQFRLKVPKTRAGTRSIVISDQALEALRSHRERMVAEGYDEAQIFCSQAGTFLRASNVSRRDYNRVVGNADIPRYRFHDIRHANASLLLSAGVNIKVLSLRLGHENIQITLDTYAHLMPTDQHACADVMGRLIGGSEARSSFGGQ